MSVPQKNAMKAAAKRLREVLTYERIKSIAKYRNFNMAQYLELVNKVEEFGILILESYISNQNNIT